MKDYINNILASIEDVKVAEESVTDNTSAFINKFLLDVIPDRLVIGTTPSDLSEQFNVKYIHYESHAGKTILVDTIQFFHRTDNTWCLRIAGPLLKKNGDLSAMNGEQSYDIVITSD